MSDEDPVASLATEDRRIVTVAFEQGYFSPAAEVTVADLAAESGVSDREARRRLARGLATLLKEYRHVSGPEDVEGLLADSAWID